MSRSCRRRLLAGLGLALAALLALLPLLFGIAAEKRLESDIARFARASGLLLASHARTRGWFATEAESVLRVPGLPLEVLVQHRIVHGPFPVARWLEGELDWRPVRAITRSQFRLRPASGQRAEAGPDDEAASLERLLAGMPPLVTDTAVLLDGRLAARFEHAAFMRGYARGELEWDGLKGRLDLDAAGRTLDLEAHAPRLALRRRPAATGDAARKEALGLEGTVLRVRLERGEAGDFLFGETSLSVARFVLAPFLEARALRFVSTARPAEAGRYLHLVLGYELGAATLAGQSLGPARLNIEVRRLDVAPLARFDTEIAALAGSGGERPAEQVSLLVLGKTLELAAALAKHAPELELSAFSLRVGGEEIRARAQLVLDGRRLAVRENPRWLLVALKGEAELAIPARLLARWYLPEVRAAVADYARRGLLEEAQLAQLTPQRLETIAEEALPHYLARHELARHLVRDGADYKLRLAVRRGQLLLNGEPWQPGSAIGP